MMSSMIGEGMIGDGIGGELMGSVRVSVVVFVF